MSDVIHTETIKRNGASYLVSLVRDECTDAPWDNSAGHGTVDTIGLRERVPHGWCEIASARCTRWVYHQGAAFVQAYREGWGLSDTELTKLTKELGKKPSKGKIRARAVALDIAYLTGYLNGDWCYVGVCDQQGDPRGAPLYIYPVAKLGASKIDEVYNSIGIAVYK